MNIPQLTAAAEQQGRMQRFEVAIKALEDGLATNHIWNVDFVSAKDQLSRVAEKALDISSEDIRALVREGREGRPSWQNEDPRWMVIYHPQFSNVPGALKKLTKYTKDMGKWTPAYTTFLNMLAEIAQVVELVRAVKPFIEKGRKPNPNPKEVDVTNTGICSVCSSRQKLNFNGTLVAHGYTLERNWGGRNGICFGAGYKAWELASDGAVAYKEAMVAAVGRTESLLADLKADKFDKMDEMVEVVRAGVYNKERREYDRTDVDNFSRVKRIKEEKAKRSILALKSDIEFFTAKLAKWKAEPLKYGGAETQERWKAKFLTKGAQ